jgi:hypothetical protein
MNDTPEILVLFAAGGNGAPEAPARHLGAGEIRAWPATYTLSP